MKPFQKIGVIGAGQMGAGIAQVAASAGYQVVLYDAIPEVPEKALSQMVARLEKQIAKGSATAEQLEGVKSNIQCAGELSAFSDAEFVVEAVVENFEVKAKLFQALDEIVSDTTILASNTSSISITKMAAKVQRAEHFIGVHFMNPVPVMELVELIRGLQTSDKTYEKAVAFVSSLQKTDVLAIDSAGFIVNRILVPMVNEAIFLLQEGVRPEDIDTAMKLGTNQPMGPLTLADFVGLDTLLSIMRILHRELGEDKYRPCPLLVRYVEAGWYGKKVGRGFYRYDL